MARTALLCGRDVPAPAHQPEQMAVARDGASDRADQKRDHDLRAAVKDDRGAIAT
jgi:hypothetical protein